MQAMCKVDGLITVPNRPQKVDHNLINMVHFGLVQVCALNLKQ